MRASLFRQAEPAEEQDTVDNGEPILAGVNPDGARRRSPQESGPLADTTEAKVKICQASPYVAWVLGAVEDDEEDDKRDCA